MKCARGRAAAIALSIAAVAAGAACSARGINGERTDDRAAAELRADATAMAGRSFRFQTTESVDGVNGPYVAGTFSPPNHVTLAQPAPGAIPAAANPGLLFADIGHTQYVTRSAGSLRFNLPAQDLDHLVGGTAADDDDFTGEAFVSGGWITRVRFQATRSGHHYLADLRTSPA